MDFIKEGNSVTGYLNESSSSDGDFNLNSSMPRHSDIDISGPHTSNNGKFPREVGLQFLHLWTWWWITDFHSVF